MQSRCARRPISRVTRPAAMMLLATGVTAPAAAQPPMRMTTPIPEGIATPNRLETSIGTLTSVDGVPDAATTERVFDFLDLNRAVTAYLSTLQVASMYAMEQGLRSFGPPNTTVLQFESLMDSKALWLTPNTVSVYQALWLELGDEPMVLETPPKVLGIIDDAWFQYVGDFGNAGPDRGQGGKFLILPPGFDGPVPDGYHVFRTNTLGNWLAWRGFQENGSTRPAVEATQRQFRVYPLSQAANPPRMNFINVSGTPHNTIHRMDFGYWEEVNAQIQDETLLGLDPEVRGLLAAIGIEKGRPFEPDERMRHILTDAADIGAVTARALTARPRGQEFYVYPGRRNWTNPLPGGRYDFLEGAARMLDARIYMHFYATGITPAMAARNVGVGSQYLIAYLDSNGEALDGSRTYRVNLPPNIPAKDFWSFTAYDNQTRSMLQTDEQFPGIDNLGGDVRQNDDGSVDIYFAPEAPRGWENNWIQTVPGKGFNLIFRLYGPLEPFYDQSWMPGDLEPVR